MLEEFSVYTNGFLIYIINYCTWVRIIAHWVDAFVTFLQGKLAEPGDVIFPRVRRVGTSIDQSSEQRKDIFLVTRMMIYFIQRSCSPLFFVRRL